MTVYLLHFDRPVGSDKHKAQHYCGFTSNLNKRIDWHRRVGGSSIMKHLKQEGISFEVAQIWPVGGRELEKNLKAAKSFPRICPICRENKKKKNNK